MELAGDCSRDDISLGNHSEHAYGILWITAHAGAILSSGARVPAKKYKERGEQLKLLASFLLLASVATDYAQRGDIQDAADDIRAFWDRPN